MKKILFVEDEEDIVELYRVILTEPGFEFEYFTCAVKACEYLHQNQVDLVVCDETLNDRHGLEVLQAIRNSHVNKHTIFYLASGNPNLNKNLYQEFDCRRFFQKPFDIDDIMVMIKKDLN